jgi:hypothetical protein
VPTQITISILINTKNGCQNGKEVDCVKYMFGHILSYFLLIAMSLVSTTRFMMSRKPLETFTNSLQHYSNLDTSKLAAKVDKMSIKIKVKYNVCANYWVYSFLAQ